MATALVVGAGLAGARCAETLRAEGFDGRILLVGEEPTAPYERPALSKELLSGARAAADLALRPDSFWADAGVELRLGTRIVSVDAGARVAFTGSGEELRWDSIVLATGARARRLPGAETVPGVHVLRTLADAEALRAELRPGTRLAVIGAGFIGAEAASTALRLGVSVTIVEPEPVPLARVLGLEVGAVLADRMRAHGIELRLGAGVERLRLGGDGRVVALELRDGSLVECDAVLVGIGAAPADELVTGTAALAPRGGILTDGCGRTALPDVYACGDVACSWRPSLGGQRRVEHWTSAAQQGATVARAILGRAEPYDELPYFWSDQLGLRLQRVGRHDAWERIELDGEADAFTARYLDADGRLVAALAANRPKALGGLRQELAAAA